MKYIYSSIFVVATGIFFMATATVTSAEEKKPGSYTDRSARQASSNNTDNKKVEKSEKEEAQQEEAGCRGRHNKGPARHRGGAGEEKGLHLCI